MALSPRIEIRQNQSLVMTPQLQQAIKLLQMSNLELADFVAAEVEKNPLLEPAPPTLAMSAPAMSRSGGDGVLLDTVASEVTLRDHLREQIGAARIDAAIAKVALILADELEEDGYLRAPLAEVAARHRLALPDLARGLAVLQSCDPVGVGARSLRECLALQLKDLDRFDPAMQALMEHLDLFAQRDATDLPALCGVDAADLAEMRAELRALDPKPGLRFAPPPVQIAVPDVYVLRAAGGGWTVELNTETLPRVLVNNVYAARLGGCDAETRRYVSECSAAATWLVRSLEQRARTILRVASEIVLHQDRFFGEGVAQLRPLTQRAIADRLGMHESTVSRVTAGKTLASGQGTFALRFFFSASIQAMDGGEGFSAAAVQLRIRHFIQAEAGKRTFSDDRIVAMLKGEGIDIARRTVAKYREGMGIPSSVERRRLKTATARA